MKALSKWSICLLLLALWAVPAAQAQQSGSITGRVLDTEDNQPLPGANVILTRPGSTAIIKGTTTDADGSFVLTGVEPGTYELAFSFVGYTESRQPVTVSAGQSATVNASIVPGGIGLDNVVVSASRQAEKVLDAPASVSILGPEEIQREQVGISSSAVLRNTIGVDMATTGVDRQEIVLRGFNNAFSGATYVMTDYRQAAVPSLGVNIFSIMPNAGLDLERVEIVRGPGSALYGAGVDAGVIHFITKDPFTYPGTAVSLAGGERSAFVGDFRHAGVVGGNFGYKITGSYGRADDWEMDPEDPQDRAQLDRSQIPRNNDYEKLNGNLTLQYRFRPDVTLTANGGYSRVDATVLSGIGTVQGDGFGYSYGQLRLQAGSFFAQAYANRNAAGDSFVYDTGNRVVDESTQYVAQAQYDLGLSDGRQRFIFGADVDITNPETEETILGRNEDETLQEYGAYVQSATQINSKLDLTLALRADYHNVVEEAALSPRAALVYKVTPEHSVRATYNRAFAAPGINSLFLDIEAARIPIPSSPISGPIVFRARGAANGFTFENATAGGNITASGLLPGLYGMDLPYATPGTPVTNVPLAGVYSIFYGGLSALSTDEIRDRLPPNLQALPDEQIQFIIDRLAPTAFGQPPDPNQTNVGGLGFSVLSGVPEDVEPIKPTITQTLEAGYKGLLGNRLVLSVDAYYSQKENFVGGPNPLTAAYFANAQTQLTGPLATAIQNNAQLNGALQAMGIPAEALASLLAGIAAETFDPVIAQELGDIPLPVAAVQPDQNAVPGEMVLSYRNFGQVQYWGADIGAEMAATDRLNLFGNVSFISDDFFDNEELDESNTSLSVALHAPTFKAKGGFGYQIPRGLFVGASGRYIEGFPVQQGPYVGDVESYFLLDAALGYDLDRYVPGLRLDFTVQNILDNDHREYVGAPEIGRLALLRLTYATR